MNEWAVLDWWQYFCQNSARIYTQTYGSVHLTCYYTDIAPLRHKDSRILRGLSIPWGAYFCFTGLKTVEQLEPGDTTTHTFIITPWQECQTLYFAFKGTVAGILSPSASPIFTLHHPGGPENPTILRPNAPGDYCGIKGQVGDPCPNHWKNVDESTPDENTTYVIQGGVVTAWGYDLYHIPNPISPITIPIEKVQITARLKYIGGYAYASSARIIITTHGSIYRTVTFSPLLSTWKDYHWHIYNNPFTNQPWVNSEINDLQIGLELRCYWGVGWATDTACTQLYASIYFTC